MSLWLILVILPASFFLVLCCVFPILVWTRCMKNRITQTEPNPNEVICDIETKNELGDNDSCNSSIITDRPRSKILNRTSVISEKNEQASDEEFYSESPIYQQNVSAAYCLGGETKGIKSDVSISSSARENLTTLIPQKVDTSTDNLIVFRHGSSILTMGINSKYYEANDKITNDGECNDEITDSESGNESTDEESGDKITGKKSDEKLTFEIPCNVVTDEGGSKITDEECGDKITGKESDEKLTFEIPGNNFTDQECGSKITDEESDKINEEKFEDNTTDTIDTNDDDKSNEISNQEYYNSDKNLIAEELSNTSNHNLLPETFISSEIDVDQCMFKKYFAANHKIVHVLNSCSNNLDILEDLSAQMYEDFHISTANEEAGCSHEIINNISVHTHEISGNCIPNDLKSDVDVCERNDSYKYSLDIIPMKFIYPCLPHSMHNC